MPGFADRRAGFTALVTASLLVTVAANLSPTLVSALAVQISDDLDIGETQIGMTVSAFFFVGALTSAWSGRTVERIGPAAGLRLSTGAACAGLLAIAALARSWPTLLLLVGAAGLANAWGQPAANLYVARGISIWRQGLALGIQKSGIPAASLLSGLAIPTVGLTIGWRWAFVIGALIAMAVSLGVPAVDGAGDTPAKPAKSAKPDKFAEPAKSAKSDKPAKPRVSEDPRPDVAVRLLVTVTCSTGLAAMGSVSLSSFFVLSSVNIGVDEAAAGVLLMAGSLVGIASRLAMGAGADRAGLNPFHMLTTMFGVAALAFVGLATGSATVLYLSLPFAFATSFAWPGLFHLAMLRSNPSAPGAATGITMTGNFTGAVIGPLLFGWLVETSSYGWGWGFAALTSAVASLVMALSGRLISRRA
ncbi:MAG: MFS transporter [Acidimicrobiaceae bacterium]|nr:MFS transporter [Acidimicrobiaceae bacterium]MCY4280473.1 MFS transporter [Acidimicrobiaceae bacterium]MCY4294843.1 MFS transporter [Acidimicrobiaceae bacterium]